MKKEVKVWAPATVANLNVGFDSLGCALSNPGEEMILRRTSAKGVVRVKAVHGAELDLDPKRNIAAVAAQSLLTAMGNPCGIEMEIFKEIMPGSGIGSSAASAAAAAVAANELLGAGLRPNELLPFALDGEQLASGVRHADNVAPALLGGLVFCPPIGAPISLPIPMDWHLLVMHPQIEVKTADSRSVLPRTVPFDAAVLQARWMGAFISACHRDDSEQAMLALEDLLVEPHRQDLIPHFKEVKQLALSSGALVGGISGSGPSTFWICKDRENSETVAKAFRSFIVVKDTPFHLHHSQISAQGAHVVA